MAELTQNYQYTYSFEDVHTDFATQEIDSAKIVQSLKIKDYEGQWLKDHDTR